MEVPAQTGDTLVDLRGRDPLGALTRLAHGGFRIVLADESIRREPAAEAWLLDTPGIEVAIVAPGEPVEAGARPRVVLELAEPAGPVAAVERAEVTLVAAGAAVADAVAAADLLAREHGLQAEVVELRVLAPLDLGPVLASVERTNRCVIVEVGQPAGGLGAVVAAAVAAGAFDALDSPVARAEGDGVLTAALDLR